MTELLDMNYNTFAKAGGGIFLGGQLLESGDAAFAAKYTLVPHGLLDKVRVVYPYLLQSYHISTTI